MKGFKELLRNAWDCGAHFSILAETSYELQTLGSELYFAHYIAECLWTPNLLPISFTMEWIKNEWLM